VGEFFRKSFDGDVSAESGIATAIHLTHAA
jgi:hypothetical protein